MNQAIRQKVYQQALQSSEVLEVVVGSRDVMAN
jgi:hypothetical protein